MSYYKTCPLCGATLDPEETCDCSRGKPLRELSPEECREQISAEAAAIESGFMLQNILRFIRILRRKEAWK